MGKLPLLRELGDIVERIQENYTSEKLFGAVDNCLYDAAYLVLRHTTLYEECLSVLLNYQTRKQLHLITQKELTLLVYKFHFASGKHKLQLMKDMKFNRDLITLPIDIVLSKADKYLRALESGSYETYEIRKSLKCRDPDKDISVVLLQIKAHYDRYLLLREAIIEKYYRLIVQEIGRMGAILQDKIDSEDIATEYYISTVKAFGKFDITSGAFTSYLKNWHKNAKSASFYTDEIGIAYTIPNNMRNLVGKGEVDITNYSSELHENMETNPFEIENDTELIAQLLEVYDPKGMYRLLNDIEFDIVQVIKNNSVN